MKLAIMGAGMIVKDFLTIAKDLPAIEFKAIIGTEADRVTMKELCETYPIGNYYTDFDQCMKQEDVDTVYIGLPNHLHYPFAKKALEYDKHVVCEKPFTLRLKELEELDLIAKSRSLILIEAITTQYLGNYKAIKELLPCLGDIKLIQCNYSQYSSRYDAFKAGEILPAFNPKFGGGALMDINLYNIHFVLGLMGKPSSLHYLANVERGVDTSGILTLNYPDKQVVCIGAKDCASQAYTSIQGTKGVIEIRSSNNLILDFELRYYNGESKLINKNSHPHRMYEEFLEFERVIKEKDFDFANQRMIHSKAVIATIEEALQSADIHLG